MDSDKQKKWKRIKKMPNEYSSSSESDGVEPVGAETIEQGNPEADQVGPANQVAAQVGPANPEADQGGPTNPEEDQVGPTNPKTAQMEQGNPEAAQVEEKTAPSTSTDVESDTESVQFVEEIRFVGEAAAVTSDNPSAAATSPAVTSSAGVNLEDDSNQYLNPQFVEDQLIQPNTRVPGVSTSSETVPEQPEGGITVDAPPASHQSFADLRRIIKGIMTDAQDKVQKEITKYEKQWREVISAAEKTIKEQDKKIDDIKKAIGIHESPASTKAASAKRIQPDKQIAGPSKAISRGGPASVTSSTETALVSCKEEDDSVPPLTSKRQSIDKQKKGYKPGPKSFKMKQTSGTSTLNPSTTATWDETQERPMFPCQFCKQVFHSRTSKLRHEHKTCPDNPDSCVNAKKKAPSDKDEECWSSSD